MSENAAGPVSEEEYITLRADEWQRYQAYVAGLEQRVSDYEAEEVRREEHNRERATALAAEEQRSQRVRSSVKRLRLLYAGGWVSYAIAGGSVLLLAVAALPTAIPQAMAGNFASWLPLVVLFATLIVPLMMSGYQRAQRPLAVLFTGIIGPLIIWGLILLGDYAGVATVLPATPAAT